METKTGNYDIASPKIVAFGGGTGLSTMLRGLKGYIEDITAVVTMADDGGGSGMLRRDLNMLPPGDIRNCILALSQTEPIMEKLLRYRFQHGSLSGQNFGNLFLAAMNEIFDGDFITAVRNVSSVLRVQGKVLPVTVTDVELVAQLENGQHITGESAIGKCVDTYGSRIKRIKLCSKGNDHDKPVEMVPEVAEEIAGADLIILGPGSLYTSILPNLAVPGVIECIQSSDVPVVYINNIMTQPGETDGYTAFDHVQAILEHSSPDLLDYCIVNTNTVETPLLSKYIEREAEVVVPDLHRFEGTGIHVFTRNLVGIENERYIRHDPEILADAILDVYNYSRRKGDVSYEGVMLYKPKRNAPNQ